MPDPARARPGQEIRAIGLVEVRAMSASEGEGQTLGGYAAVFNSPTDIGGFFREQIAPGAFTKAIGRDDVRALFNHDPNYVLGRTANHTLTLSEDGKGLQFEASPPDTAWAADLMKSVARGDISQCSFCFIAQREEWDDTGDLPLRTVLECELLDVSVVTYPAYADTSVALRSLQDARAAREAQEALERREQSMTNPTGAHVRARLAMRQAAAERGLRL